MMSSRISFHILMMLVSFTSAADPATPPNPSTAASILNRRWMSFDEHNDSSEMGVTMSFAHHPRNFSENVFCAPLLHTSCYGAEADCRMSCGFYSHKMYPAGAKFQQSVMHATVGWVIDQKAVEERFGKCYFVGDGGTWYQLNNGCGNRTIYDENCDNCSEPCSPFKDICPSTGKTCTASDPEIRGYLVGDGSGMCAATKKNITRDWANTQGPCFFEGPTLDYPRVSGDSQLRTMAKTILSLELQQFVAEMGYNEIVLDLRALLPALDVNAASVISAFIYILGAKGAREDAIAMRDDFCKRYRVKSIPVIAIDPNKTITDEGPFVIEGAVESALTMLV